ncbi:hypothetical protein H0E87_029789 [Populus deltoides]|uniref:Uncharacterized protein n=1 Tax=Populus deltoides TaxID=3696 RepID=A0A8T2WRY6_POPDE|nr:hypothetical protein H0E87_029789 [Populus deltoides]
MGSGFGHGLVSLENKAAAVTSGIMGNTWLLVMQDGFSLVHDMMSSLSSASGSMNLNLGGVIMTLELAVGSPHGGGNDDLTRDFLFMESIFHKDTGSITSPPSTYIWAKEPKSTTTLATRLAIYGSICHHLPFSPS